jgi:hypothetical protein
MSAASLAAVAEMVLGLVAVLPLAGAAAFLALFLLPVAVAGISNATPSSLMGMAMLFTLAAIPLVCAWPFARGLVAACLGRRLPRKRAVIAALIIPAGLLGISRVTPEHIVSGVIRETAGGELFYPLTGVAVGCMALTLLLRSPDRCADGGDAA